MSVNARSRIAAAIHAAKANTNGVEEAEALLRELEEAYTEAKQAHQQAVQVAEEATLENEEACEKAAEEAFEASSEARSAVRMQKRKLALVRQAASAPGVDDVMTQILSEIDQQERTALAKAQLERQQEITRVLATIDLDRPVDYLSNFLVTMLTIHSNNEPELTLPAVTSGPSTTIPHLAQVQSMQVSEATTTTTTATTNGEPTHTSVQEEIPSVQDMERQIERQRDAVMLGNKALQAIPAVIPTTSTTGFIFTQNQ